YNNYDLVNISNQRILDYGKDSLFKTIDNINSSKLDYTGVYHNEDDKKVKIVDIEGIKTGIISYTYEPKDIELDKDNQYVANFLCNEDSKDFDDVKDKVNNDFKQLRNNGAELILVIVHNSYNNNHVYDKTQKVWNELFAKLGADIVLGNNSSSVQRIEYYDKTVVVNSTGNMISNEYGEDNDLSMMVKIYVDKDRKDINAISIIPLYSFKENNKGYVTIPIYDGFNNSELNKKLSYKDIERMKKGIEIISKESMDVLLNNDILEKEYFYFTDGYKRQEVEKLDLSVEEENSSIYKVMKKSNKTCYIGDDYTAGNKNGGFGWFEPLVSTFDNEYVKISNIGINSSDAVNKYKDIINNSNCDLYVVALGSNDIRKNYLNV
ncbi:MAG TPA: hypothetical protein DCE23_09360, partial [Firmicutes bacterium]|nr:hypothetical protein [Bacillota bacterium]